MCVCVCVCVCVCGQPRKTPASMHFEQNKALVRMVHLVVVSCGSRWCMYKIWAEVVPIVNGVNDVQTQVKAPSCIV